MAGDAVHDGGVGGQKAEASVARDGGGQSPDGDQAGAQLDFAVVADAGVRHGGEASFPPDSGGLGVGRGGDEKGAE
ncbi:hypothetical protein D3C72_2426540 [compost metagenome]